MANKQFTSNKAKIPLQPEDKSEDKTILRNRSSSVMTENKHAIKDKIAMFTEGYSTMPKDINIIDSTYEVDILSVAYAM